MILIKLSKHFPMRVADWLIAGILLSWGLAVLYVPETTWNMPLYIGLRRLGLAQDTWGLLGVTIGTCRMFALFLNGGVRRSPHARAIGAFLGAGIWLQLSFAMFNSNYPAISVVFYPWLFVGDAYNVYRAAQDARLSDNRARQAQPPKQGAKPDATST